MTIWLQGFQGSGQPISDYVDRHGNSFTGSTAVRTDSIRVFFKELMDGLYDPPDALKGMPGYLRRLAELPRGRLYSAKDKGTAGGTTFVRRDVDPAKAVGELAIANTLLSYHAHLKASASPSPSDIEDWTDWTRVRFVAEAQSQIAERVEHLSTLLEQALRGTAFRRHLKTLSPDRYMACVLDVVDVLMRTGRLKLHLATITPEDALHPTRMAEVFDLFEMPETADDPTGTLKIRTDAKWGGAALTGGNLKELQTFLAGSKGAKALGYYNLYTGKVLPLMAMWKLPALRGASGADLKAFLDPLRARSLRPYYPASAGIAAGDDLATLKAKAAAFDAAHPTHWRDLDRGARAVRSLSTFSTIHGSIAKQLAFLAAIETLFTKDSLDGADLKDFLKSGIDYSDDVIRLLGQVRPNASTLTGSALLGEAAGRVLPRLLFVISVIDFALSIKAIAGSRTPGETLARAVVSTGAFVGLAASGLGLLAAAGLIAIPAAPLLIVGLVSTIVGMIGSALVSALTQSDAELILRGCCFRKPGDAADLVAAIKALPLPGPDPRFGFILTGGAADEEDYGLQLAYLRGLQGAMGPTITKDGTNRIYAWSNRPDGRAFYPLSDIEVEIVATDGPSDATTVDLIEHELKNNASGTATVPGGPDAIEQTTTLKGRPAFPDAFSDAVIRRAMHLAGQVTGLVSEDATIIERAHA